MNLKQIVKNKKFKNFLLTICEILIVASLIFGVLMFFQSKINKDASQSGKLDNSNTSSREAETEEKGSDKYYIEVNIKKNAMIVYQYSLDNKTKEPYKVFKCSVGKDVKKGKYKTANQYSWVDSNGNWHKYNTQFDTSSWIQSAGYSDKYDNTLKKSSYNAIGSSQKAGSCILLYAKDAEWIYRKCKNTVVKIIKGKKSDKLPLEAEETVSLSKYCGWDPTDPDEANPYKKCKNGEIVTGLTTVYVERGKKAQYLSNLIARDENGKNISGLLKYKKFNTKKTGTYKVKFSYKTSSGKTIEAVQKFKVIDTTPPKVTCSKTRFSYQVDSRSIEDLNKESNRKAIESMVRASVSCNESDAKITVSTVSKDELNIGSNVVVIKAQDKSGNVGSCQVICDISIKAKKYNKKYTPDKEVKEQLKDNAKKKDSKEKETKKKKEKETTKKITETETQETTTVNE